MSYEISKELKERLDQMEEIGSTLDKHCSLLISFFGVVGTKNTQGTLGFNEILKTLEKLRKDRFLGFSRQTLSLHLKHLLEKGLIEVEEKKESPLKIKPRKYRLSKFWVELRKQVDPLYIPSFEDGLNELRNLPTEELTLTVMMAIQKLSLKMMIYTLTLPEFLGNGYRNYCYSYLDNFAEIYRHIILKRKDLQKVASVLNEHNNFLTQYLNEKYPSRE